MSCSSNFANPNGFKMAIMIQIDARWYYIQIDDSASDFDFKAGPL